MNTKINENPDLTANRRKSDTPRQIQSLLHEIEVQHVELELQNEELRKAQEQLDVSRQRYFDLFDLAPVGYITMDDKGIIAETNLYAAALLGLTRGELTGKAIQHYISPEDQNIYYLNHNKLLSSKKPRIYEIRMLQKNGQILWVSVTVIVVNQSNSQWIVRMVISDITDRKLSEELLHRIEWMLTQKNQSPIIRNIPHSVSGKAVSDAVSWDADNNHSENMNIGEIRRCIDPKTLFDIASEYLDYLGSFAAIFEKDGDHAYGVFASSWCSLLDNQSRKLCATQDQAEAIESGKWLCHQSHWQSCSQKAITQKIPIDIQCHGGIYLYAVPIFAEGLVIGTITFSYGDPPKKAVELRRLEKLYKLDKGALSPEADKYESRPAFIIEMAKTRLQSSANLLGRLVEQMRLQSALKESEQRFKRISSGISDYLYSVWIENGKTVASIHDPTCLSVTGYTSNEFALNPYLWIDMVDSRDRKFVTDYLLQILNGASLPPLEHRIIRKDSKLAWISNTIIPKQDKNGTLISYDGVIKDISARKQIELDVWQAKKDAELANLAKGRYLTTISHDIRSPLSGIIGLSSLLNDTDLNPEQREFVQMISTSGNNLLQLINDILDFSKIEANKMELNIALFNLHELVKSSVSILTINGTGEKLVIKTNIDSSVPTLLLGDQKRLGQVFNNFLSNAIKFTASGIVTISVNTISVINDQITIIFRITDTGIGISPENIKHLFQPFVQAEKNISGLFGGTGLGLTICKHLVALMGGEIKVISKIKKGSEFSFTANFLIPSENVDNSSKQMGNVKHNKIYEHDYKHIRILLADDDSINRVIVHKMLTKLGYSVDVVSDGSQLISALETTDYSLIFTDCQMPIIDGFKAAAIIRDPASNVCNHTIAIIGLTANSSTEDLKLCLKSGMDDYLIKPASIDDLEKIIEKYILSTN